MHPSFVDDFQPPTCSPEIDGLACRLAAFLLCQGGQHAVYECSTSFGAESLCKTHCFGDHDGSRGVGFKSQLVEAEAQDCPVDHRHALHPPMIRGLVDLVIEFADVFEHPGHESGCLGRQIIIARRQIQLIRFIESLNRQIAGFDGHARVMYEPLRVSTLIRSPMVTKSGTWTMRPVWVRAGLVALETRSPFTPGSV